VDCYSAIDTSANVIAHSWNAESVLCACMHVFSFVQCAFRLMLILKSLVARTCQKVLSISGKRYYAVQVCMLGLSSDACREKRDSEDLAKKNCAMHFKAYIS
jgi:hypothetical protein